ncbi:MAG: non-canonical purine NTP pyrophosphatase [Gaiellaceae bacterium]
MSTSAPPRSIALASGNAHKAQEWQALLPGWRVETLDMRDAPAETGHTFGANALAKARFGATVASAGGWVLGEDSGLAVATLGGAPGIRSARYAGEGATDADNMTLLLAEMAGASDRRARFVCSAACLLSEGPDVEGERPTLHADGVLEGEIAQAPRGDAGFGYDPIFVPAGEVKTVAELGEGWKQARSHRAQAAKHLLEQLDRW